MRVQNASRNWRLALLAFLVAGAGFAAADRDNTMEPSWRVSIPRAENAQDGARLDDGGARFQGRPSGNASADGQDEPAPPDLIDVKRDANDSQSVNVTLRAGMTANARLEVTSDQGGTWIGKSAPASFRLERGQSARKFAFRAKTPKTGQSNRVSARITLLDDRGLVRLTYDKTIDLNQEAASTSATLAHGPFSKPNATDGQGEPVIVVVPKDAPAPILREAGQ